MAIHSGSRVPGLVALLGLCMGVRAAEADRVVRDLCGKSIAMLGESPLHGFGNTLEFKVGLVRRLVDECHFNAFFRISDARIQFDVASKLKGSKPEMYLQWIKMEVSAREWSKAIAIAERALKVHPKSYHV